MNPVTNITLNPNDVVISIDELPETKAQELCKKELKNFIENSLETIRFMAKLNKGLKEVFENCEQKLGSCGIITMVALNALSPFSKDGYLMPSGLVEKDGSSLYREFYKNTIEEIVKNVSNLNEKLNPYNLQIEIENLSNHLEIKSWPNQVNSKLLLDGRLELTKRWLIKDYNIIVGYYNSIRKVRINAQDALKELEKLFPSPKETNCSTKKTNCIIQ